MEIKGTIKEITLTEKQAKVILHPQPDYPDGNNLRLAEAYRKGLIMSSNQLIQMQSVRLMSEGIDIEGKSVVADCYENPGKVGTRWAGMMFYNINSIELVIQREDELKEPEAPLQGTEKPVEVTTADPLPSWVNEDTKEQDEALPPSEREVAKALAYTPESASMEIGKKFLEIATLTNEFFKVFKK